ncbi:AAA family ATPase [Helicobacter cappadocius]|uniref:AAA family ATPase n=1 Tax=Helicobacter cappadocius TaxID=3063998 RepID=A0AA90TB93_9HELI|nr:MULTISPECIES: AAA family ATPase [unclassified Helicobacter]MDO7252713.1 AAA family ATPase [Helicobacter sp. faydin-H75]MDP2538581.1 AAA family ATPase [Helicobacter sp. faydin-H76]
MKNKNNLKIGIIGIVVVLVLIVFMFSKDNSQLISQKSFEEFLQTHSISQVSADKQYFYFTFENKTYKVAKIGIDSSILHNIPIQIKTDISIPIILNTITIFILFGIAFVLFWKKRIQVQNSSTSLLLENGPFVSKENIPEKSNTSLVAINSSVRFKDVAGIKEAKEELIEIIDYLKNPQKYKELGISLPRGVLLVGPPGVGKTMIAKAVAGEANVPFFYQSGSSFVQIYVGMGAKRVRELFSKAKANSPSIVFIDEIDAVGKARGEGRNDEREATLNELLTEMDGFGDNNNVIVIGATNNIEVIDEALLRSGRFDRRIYVEMPDLEERKEIFQVYLQNKKHNLNLVEISKMCVGFSGAMIASVVNESALNAFRRKSDIIELKDILDVKDKVALGKKKIISLNEEEKNILSLYQSAKVISAYYLNIDFDKVALVSDFIIDKNKEILSRSEMNNKIKVYLSGVIALELIMSEKYTNAKEDIKKAKNIAKEMCEVYGMANKIITKDLDISRILSAAHLEQMEFLNNYKEVIISLSKVLLEKERLTKQNIEEIINKR